jgi:hypothetical protein
MDSASCTPWLDGRDALIVRADRREPLVILPLKLAAAIAETAEQRKPVENQNDGAPELPFG